MSVQRTFMKPDYLLPTLPVPRTSPPRTPLGRWFMHTRLDEAHGHPAASPWYRVLWLTGVDYFSTLGYQPGIALLAAGALAPSATAILLLVTLLGALPTYVEVAKRSYAGQGSIAMLENLLPGWKGKLLVLILLGFAGTDFVITMTLSAADAAKHAVENPYLRPLFGEAQLELTLLFLALLAMVFLKGFREAIGLATAVAVPYLLLNLIVIARAFVEVARQPEVIAEWRVSLGMHGDWTMMLMASAFIFPRLALGLSGFETGVTVMPLISGGPEPDERVIGRERSARSLPLFVPCRLAFDANRRYLSPGSLEVGIEPLDHGAIPQLAVLRLEHPMALIGEIKQLRGNAHPL